MTSLEFVLASKSPARLHTLRNAGIEPTVRVSHVDEDALLDRLSNPTPSQTVCTLARAKALSVAQTLDLTSAIVLVGADSMLQIDGVLQGKPHDPQTARERWRAMSGRSGVLHTGHALYISYSAHQVPNPLPTRLPLCHNSSKLGQTVTAERRDGGTLLVAHAQTRIMFAHLDDTEIDAYIETGEPLQVAGGFTVDGLGGAFIEGIEGDPHSVVGISLPLLRLMCASVGLGWHRLWSCV